ncbi:hypothetical protein EH244_12165 [Variovorax beijingensis]|uniref:Phage integrase family protein n=1 Tax=Variovorax beijingensis TaxID=2496117 RepID=A0A3P3EPS2_9BURK|nr:hypothetical protein [Variovorax beijingensis]RRH88389.1 hypothetical protein EH244_12165 [Variovorax beijingensis]
MDRWAKPYQAKIEAEIARRRAADPLDPEIAEAQRHLKAVFLAAIPQQHNLVRTVSVHSWNKVLKAFAKDAGVSWTLATHQFRRKFANYAARSQFGDLRYLREHFKHWSMDMTLGYALNESQEVKLYIEIQDELDDIKAGLADSCKQPGKSYCPHETEYDSVTDHSCSSQAALGRNRWKPPMNSSSICAYSTMYVPRGSWMLM